MEPKEELALLKRLQQHMVMLHGEDAYGGAEHVRDVVDCNCDLGNDYRALMELIEWKVLQGALS